MQLTYVVVAVGLALLVPRVSVGETLPTGRATEMLIAVGAGFVPFIGIVYSLLFLVVQFGSTTFTHRLSLFREAPLVWHAFSYFTGVIVFAFTGVLVIAGDEETTLLLPTVLLLLVLAAIGVFRRLQTTAFESIQLAPTLAQVVRRGREVIDGVYPDALPTDPSPTGPAHQAGGPPLGSDHGRREVVWAGSATTLQWIDVPHLVGTAERADARIELRVVPGQTVPERGVVASLSAGADKGLEREVIGALRMGVERSFEQDPAFALRVLADIALRALSPAINDPTTAVQALDALDALLRPLSARDLDIGQIHGSDGELRLVLSLPSWDDYLGVALDEIILMQAGSIHVRGRLRRLLAELILVAPTQRRGPLEARLAFVGETGHRSVTADG